VINITNIKTGKIGAVITGLSVVVFALSMFIGYAADIYTAYVSYFVCMLIAIGYILFAAAITASNGNKQTKAAGLAAVAFASVYAVLIFIVYFAMLTTVRLNGILSYEAMSIINYDYVGSLFFNYDLLGYGFMAVSTFFIGFAVEPNNKGDKALRVLLWVHGVFFLPCIIMPMTGVFTSDTNPIIGTALLEIWCLFFLPICILGWRYFKKNA